MSTINRYPFYEGSLFFLEDWHHEYGIMNKDETLLCTLGKRVNRGAVFGLKIHDYIFHGFNRVTAWTEAAI